MRRGRRGPKHRYWCAECKRWLEDWERAEEDESGGLEHMVGRWLSPSMHVTSACGPVQTAEDAAVLRLVGGERSVS